MNMAWSVSEATSYIKGLLEEDPQLMEVWIRGELSNFKQHTRGHMYFTVKDDGSRLQSVMFAGHNSYLRFKPENGMNVLMRGEINVYEPYGQYQFYVKEMQPDGIGSLHVAFERLKKELEEEGLFDQAIKKPLPQYPAHIAVITSQTGAAIKDIMTTLKRRMPRIRVTLLPVLVQGDAAPSSIAHAVEQASIASIFDLIIMGRGGGSIEELWAFNEEIVARAIASATVPIISAVGHETDFTISDFVADLRAPTPTAAAEMAVPDYREVLNQLEAMKHRSIRSISEKLRTEQKRLETLNKSYAFRYPRQLVEQKEQQLDYLMERLSRSIKKELDVKRQALTRSNQALLRNHPHNHVTQLKSESHYLKKRLVKAMEIEMDRKKREMGSVLSKLQLLSPLTTMERGYSLAYKEEKLIKTISDVEVDDEISVTMQDGRIYTKVTGKAINTSGGGWNGSKS
ncbi:exodeoxyribonuclease VII large subunit [Alkalihalobacillus xiaoxiensis]|uniref:Exodeoxyribonuclease 7 large subunit n=1 Tax=Shouchella xiaoxiensis TaxID=766895 RepID=A0ABS2SXT7_9BACI|nr:exodeoxyribonuclease VII large subunit [Shouchella xiaoxiensis]MBM7840299.1 exodeoxyribonuclease VII large subunit [Shouchella xiaoxiensis]